MCMYVCVCVFVYVIDWCDGRLVWCFYRSAEAMAEMEDLAQVSANPDKIHIASDDEEEEEPVECEYKLSKEQWKYKCSSIYDACII